MLSIKFAKAVNAFISYLLDIFEVQGRLYLMWSNVISHLDKGRLLFLIYFYEGVFNEKTKDI